MFLRKQMKHYRMKQGLNHDELSNITGISLSSLKKYESGERVPKWEQIEKISKAIGVSPEILSPREIQTPCDVAGVLHRIGKPVEFIETGKTPEIRIKFSDVEDVSAIQKNYSAICAAVVS